MIDLRAKLRKRERPGWFARPLSPRLELSSFCQGGPAASAGVDETAEPVAGLHAYPTTAASAAGASAPLAVSGNHCPSAALSVDAPSPVSVEDSDAPGSAGRSSCPAAADISYLPLHYRSQSARDVQWEQDHLDGQRFEFDCCLIAL